MARPGMIPELKEMTKRESAALKRRIEAAEIEVAAYFEAAVMLTRAYYAAVQLGKFGGADSNSAVLHAIADAEARFARCRIEYHDAIGTGA